MKKISAILLVLLTTIITLLISSTTASSLPGDLNVCDMYYKAYQHDPSLVTMSASELTSTYGNGFALPAGGDVFWKYEEYNKNMDCINHRFNKNLNPGGANNVGYNIVSIIDISSDGTVTITSNGNSRQVTNENDRTIFYKLGVIAEANSEGNGNDQAAGWMFNFADVFKNYGVVSYGREGYDTTAFGVYDCEKTLKDYGGKISEGNTVRIFVMRCGLKGATDVVGNRVGQERLLIVSGPADPEPGILRLVKVRENTEERLPGVHFLIKRTSNDKEPSGYIQVVDLEKNDANMKKENETLTGVGKDEVDQGRTELRYTPIKDDATEFVTDGNGEIYIYGLMSGSYEAEEIENENYGFRTEPNPATFTVAGTTESESVVRATNKYTLIDLELNKTNMINGEPIDGAGFKIKTDDGKWVKDSDDPQDRLTSDESEATEYFAVNGQIVVRGLPDGHSYSWVETTFPENPETGGTFKSLDKDAGGIGVSTTEGETTSIEVQNKPIGLFRKVVKGTDKGIQGVPFEFKEYSIADEYPELMEGFTVGGASYTGSLADEHCTYNTCDEVDTKVPHYSVGWDGSTYVWYTCSLHGFDGSHADAWEARRAEYNSDVEKANNCHHGREDGVKKINEGTNSDGKRNNLTDENGNIDISPLVPDGDDGKGKFQYREIDEGMENPYFNNDHPDWTDFDYLGKTIVEDERRRMDIEGLIWVERSPDQKGGIDDPETKGEGATKGIYEEGIDQLLYPVEVRAIHKDAGGGEIEIGQGVITADGRYRIRVGGRQGEYIKYVTTEKEGTYIEFTYNGMKYQSVWPATLENEENGSKAVEKETDRRDFNDRYKTIVSNNGDAMSNKAKKDGTIINYEKLDVNGPYNYKRRVLYEGKIDGIVYPRPPAEIFGGKNEDPIGDGVYSGLQKRPKANEVDGEPNTMQQATNNDSSVFSDNVYTYSKSGGEKYQIKADTQSAGYQGIMNYKVEDDKIEHVNLGVYERTQPDIAIVNDIERVVTHINNEQYLYQYGANTQTDKDKLTGGNLQGRFQNNVNYKYKRYLRPEQIQVNQPKQNNHDDEDKFLMTVYYRTEVINQSDYVYLQPEIRTQYDSKYQPEVRDATQEVVQDKASRSQEDETSIAATMAKPNELWQTSSPLGGTNANTPSGYQEAYNTVTDKIAPGESKVFYTAYTLKRENLKDLVYDTQQMTFFNNIEVNAYSTYWADDKGQERLVNSDGAYAGIDVDSAAGNSVPSTDYGQQDDGSWAPTDDPTETFEDDNDLAPVFELNYEEPAKISGTVYLDDIIKQGDDYPTANVEQGRAAGTVQDYLGDGEYDTEHEKPVKDVKVELVELDESGKEILDGNGNTMVLVLEDKETNKNKHGNENDPLDSETFAVTTTGDDGTYSFEGFIPGEYIVKFTWGQHVTYIDPNKPNEGEKTLTSTIVDDDPNNVDDIAYVQQYKSTIFNNEERYTKMTDMKKEAGDTTTKNRWYITPGGVEYSGKSNAIDDMEMRRKIDNDILNTGNNYKKDKSGVTYNLGTTTDNEKMLTYPDLEEDEVFSGRATSIVSRTPAFDVSQQENEYTTTKDKDKVEEKEKDRDLDGNYVKINLDQVDFGISERPKQDMELEKRIQRVSVKLANGETLIDANVLWDEKTGNTRDQRMKIKDITGEIKQVAYPKDIVKNGDIGTFRMEVDEEILQGSTMEITYKYNIINESYLDYEVSNEGKTINQKGEEQFKASLPYEFQGTAELNRYYKYGNGYNGSIAEHEVEMSPSIIIDYLDNAMAWKKYDEVNYHENDLWEEVTEDENKDSGRVTDLLYDGRFKADNNIIYEKNINSYNLHNYGIENLQKQLIGDDDDDNGNIYKFYRTILRDTTKANMDTLASDYNEKDYPEESEQLKKDTERPELDRYKGQIYLKAKQISYDDVKFVASKELSDTNVDLNFYNVAEIAQVNRTGGAIPEKMIPGDNDPTNTGHTDTQNSNFEGSTEQTFTVEHDGGWASLVTITPPTGDDTNYNYIMWTAVGIAALAILGIGTLGIKKVLVPSKAVEPKEDSSKDK